MTKDEIIKHCKERIAKGDHIQFHKAILELVVKDKHPQEFSGEVYQTCVGAYKEFLEKHGVPLVMDGRAGKAMKEIIMKLKRASTEKSNAGIIRSWKFILEHWDRTGDFIGRQKSLVRINSNLQEILDKIRNGATKRDSHKTQAEQLGLALEQRRQQRTK